MPSSTGKERKPEQSEGMTHLCRTPSNCFDFFTADVSPPVPEMGEQFCRRTFITLPNSPLPSSPISTNSRSNLPGCAYVSKDKPDSFREVHTSCALSPRKCCPCPRVNCVFVCWRRVGEASVVADDPSEELDAVRLDARWLGMLDLSGESRGGIRGGGSCQPIIHQAYINRYAKPNKTGSETHGVCSLMWLWDYCPRSYSRLRLRPLRWHRYCSGATTILHLRP
jgi:hypothetical protein